MIWTVTKKLVPVDLPMGRLSAENDHGHQLNIELPVGLLRTMEVGDRFSLTLERAD